MVGYGIGELEKRAEFIKAVRSLLARSGVSASDVAGRLRDMGQAASRDKRIWRVAGGVGLGGGAFGLGNAAMQAEPNVGTAMLWIRRGKHINDMLEEQDAPSAPDTRKDL